MRIEREDILNAIDLIISGESEPVDNIKLAQNEMVKLAGSGRPDGEWNIHTHRPIIGKLIVFVKRCLRKLLHGYIVPLVMQQNALFDSQSKVIWYMLAALSELSDQNSSLKTRILGMQTELNQLHTDLSSQKAASLQELELLRNDLTSQKTAALQELELLRNDLASQKAASLQELELLRDELTSQKTAALQELELLRNDLTSQKAAALQEFNQIHSSAEAAQKETDLLHREVDIQNQDVQQKLCLLKKSADRFEKAAELGRFELPEYFSEMFPYAAFESIYRGEQSMIYGWQQIYLNYFIDKKNVLDLGCGRGEFLKLLEDNGLHGKGIDQAEDMLEYCKKQDLEVECADIFEYLDKLPDSSIDGIFCSQVVEHLSTAQLFKLVSLMKRVVRIGGVIVIETLNSCNLKTSSSDFYLDFTHIRPIHPCTLAFLLQQNGFPLQDKLFLHPETEKMLPELNIEGADGFNQKLKEINNILFGERDYAIVAYRQ